MEQQLGLVAPLNQFEAIAALYNTGTLDRDVIRQQLGDTAKIVRDRVDWFVEKTRRDNAGYYIEWDRMVADMSSRAAWHTSRP